MRRSITLRAPESTVAEASVPNPSYVAVGVNIDDDQSCYDARVRFDITDFSVLLDEAEGAADGELAVRGRWPALDDARGRRRSQR